jgi:hypothetical protein
MEEMVRQQQER